MTMGQCEDCRMGLLDITFDDEAGESGGYLCQLDERLSVRTRDLDCPFFVSWDQSLPPPTRTCKSSSAKGKGIDGCKTTAGGG